MNVEKTIEFTLNNQAKAETQMASMRKIIVTGMKMVVKQGENIEKLGEKVDKLGETVDKLSGEVSKLTADVRELARAQRTTETKLQSFIDSLRRGGNGRHSRN